MALNSHIKYCVFFPLLYKEYPNSLLVLFPNSKEKNAAILTPNVVLPTPPLLLKKVITSKKTPPLNLIIHKKKVTSNEVTKNRTYL